MTFMCSPFGIDGPDGGRWRRPHGHCARLETAEAFHAEVRVEPSKG